MITFIICTLVGLVFFINTALEGGFSLVLGISFKKAVFSQKVDIWGSLIISIIFLFFGYKNGLAFMKAQDLFVCIGSGMLTVYIITRHYFTKET